MPLIAQIIPNIAPTFWRQKLMDASTIEGHSERQDAVARITYTIRAAHPELFWSESELLAKHKAGDAARRAHEEATRRDAELAELLARPARPT